MLASGQKAHTALARAATIACVGLLGFAVMSAVDSSDASAKLLVGADVQGGAQFGDVSSDSVGFGANLRVGYKLPIPILKITPELQVNYMGFAMEDLNTMDAATTANSARQRLLSGRGGVRAGYGGLLFGASVYSHVGYGFIGTKESLTQDSGLSFDAGLAFDFRLLPIVDFGLHGGYNAIFPGSDPDADPINWIDFGAHVEVSF